MSTQTPAEQLHAVALAAIHTTRVALTLGSVVTAAVGGVLTLLALPLDWAMGPFVTIVMAGLALAVAAATLVVAGPALARVIAREVPR